METSYPLEYNLKLANIPYELFTDYMYSGEFYHDGDTTWYIIVHKHNNHRAETNTHPNVMLTT